MIIVLEDWIVVEDVLVGCSSDDVDVSLTHEDEIDAPPSTTGGPAGACRLWILLYGVIRVEIAVEDAKRLEDEEEPVSETSGAVRTTSAARIVKVSSGSKYVLELSTKLEEDCVGTGRRISGIGKGKIPSCRLDKCVDFGTQLEE